MREGTERKDEKWSLEEKGRGLKERGGAEENKKRGNERGEEERRWRRVAEERGEKGRV